MIKNFFIRLITFWIPSKKYRKATRYWLSAQSYLGKLRWNDFSKLWQFRKLPVRPNSVLIFEPNDAHSEVIVGIADYLVQLGYNVDVLLTSQSFKENAFSRYHKEQVRVIGFGQALLIPTIWLSKIKQYEFVLINTTRCLWSDLSVTQLLCGCPQGKKKTLLIEHDIRDIPFYKLDKYNDNRQIIVLGNLEEGVMVNPHHFGEIKITPKNSQTRFIVVGTINMACKNHDELIKAVQQLAQTGLDFKITVIGRGSLSALPQEVQPYIEFLGRVDFPTMYSEMEKADFFLPLLNPDIKEHLRYITTGVTGSAQLIYGFATPPLIHQKFADFYRFSDENSLVYTDNLGKAMTQAVQMSAAQYQSMQHNLHHLAENIASQSLCNLRGLING